MFPTCPPSHLLIIGRLIVSLFSGIYSGRSVLITGHTGFKGSWLALWLKELGARVVGYSLEPPTKPNHFELLKLDITSILGDIRDAKKLEEVFRTHSPEIVFHLAAQPLVRYSYKKPVETFETNLMGTINVFEACRNTGSVRAIVNITSDKCYENREWVWGYRENDTMGGYDPYSASKGCSELVTNSYRNSFFSPTHPLTCLPSHPTPSPPAILLASARAGNVIGGGDWAEDRLFPDIMKAAGENRKVTIRNPKATRPWQHIFEPLSGYLRLGQKLLEGKREFAEGWNFGPEDESNICVEDMALRVKAEWASVEYEMRSEQDNPYEAVLLKLDCSKAHARLKWRPVWDIKKTVEATTRWYKEFYEKGKINSLADLKEYILDAGNKKLEWTE